MVVAVLDVDARGVHETMPAPHRHHCRVSSAGLVAHMILCSHVPRRHVGHPVSLTHMHNRRRVHYNRTLTDFMHIDHIETSQPCSLNATTSALRFAH